MDSVCPVCTGGRRNLLFAMGLMEKRKRKMEAERQRQEEEARKKREEMLRVDEKVRRIEELHKRVMAAQKLADAASVKMGSPECVSFCAAGRNYNGIGELTAEKMEETVYKDRYGRMVLYTKERFPCFDSYDYLYEKRYFHTYLVRNEQYWTLIKAQDESDRISVREGLSGEQVKNALGSYAAQKLEKWLEKENVIP